MFQCVCNLLLSAYEISGTLGHFFSTSNQIEFIEVSITDVLFNLKLGLRFKLDEDWFLKYDTLESNKGLFEYEN